MFFRDLVRGVFKSRTEHDGDPRPERSPAVADLTDLIRFDSVREVVEALNGARETQLGDRYAIDFANRPDHHQLRAEVTDARQLLEVRTRRLWRKTPQCIHVEVPGRCGIAERTQEPDLALGQSRESLQPREAFRYGKRGDGLPGNHELLADVFRQASLDPRRLGNPDAVADDRPGSRLVWRVEEDGSQSTVSLPQRAKHRIAIDHRVIAVAIDIERENPRRLITHAIGIAVPKRLDYHPCVVVRRGDPDTGGLPCAVGGKRQSQPRAIGTVVCGGRESLQETYARRERERSARLQLERSSNLSHMTLRSHHELLSADIRILILASHSIRILINFKRKELPAVTSSERPGYLDRRIGYRLKVAEHAQRRMMDAALSEHRLTVPQYAALSILADHPGSSNADLARRGFVTPQTMTDILRALHRDGLVVRTPHPLHGRILQYTITEAGERARQRGDAAVMEIERRMLSGLSGNDEHTLHDLLGRCIASLGGADG